VLDAIGRELMARSNELDELLSREEGKTLPEGVGEVYRGGQFFIYFAGERLGPHRNHQPTGDPRRALQPPHGARRRPTFRGAASLDRASSAQGSPLQPRRAS
jgi:acyl-CoA reductase-like NAD-dependent aldehyde dehydrogenase